MKFISPDESDPVVDATPNSKKQLDMIRKFQCPGCICGGPEPAECPSLEIHTSEIGAFACDNHAPGTMILGTLSGLLYLGMPKGFNRVGPRWISHHDGACEMAGAHRIRIFLRDRRPSWDRFNIAVWALEYEGDLLVRTYCPRTNYSFVDVIEGGTRELAPDAIDVAAFQEEID